MNRKLLNVIGAGLLTVAPSVYAGSSQYPVVSTPDAQTVLDKSRSERVRRLAEYVINRPGQEGIVFHDPNRGLKPDSDPDYQSVSSVIVLDGMRYTVWVANMNEENNTSGYKDSIQISIRPDGTYGRRELSVVTDNGLDGMVNYGYMPGDVFYNESEDGVKGAEHRGTVQAALDMAIDRLLRFYEK